MKHPSDINRPQFTSRRTIDIKFQSSIYNGGTQLIILLMTWGQQPREASKLCNTSSNLTQQKFLLADAQLAIFKVTLGRSSSTEVDVPLKILIFLSFKIDHRIAKETNLKSNDPHSKKGTEFQASMSTKDLGERHGTPQLERTLFQRKVKELARHKK